MFTSKMIRHSMVALALVAVAGVAVASAGGYPIRHAGHLVDGPVPVGDLGEVVVLAPGDLGEVVVFAPHDLGEVVVFAQRSPIDAPVLAGGAATESAPVRTASA